MGDIHEMIRFYVKGVVIFFVSTLALHLAAAISILPYAWGSDLNSICGSRMTLSTITAEIWTMLLWAFVTAIISYLIIQFGDRSHFMRRVIMYGEYAIPNGHTAIMAMSLLFGFYLSVQLLHDIYYLGNPPMLPKDIAGCAARGHAP